MIEPVTITVKLSEKDASEFSKFFKTIGNTKENCPIKAKVRNYHIESVAYSAGIAEYYEKEVNIPPSKFDIIINKKVYFTKNGFDNFLKLPCFKIQNAPASDDVLNYIEIDEYSKAAMAGEYNTVISVSEKYIDRCNEKMEQNGLL